MKFYPHVPTSNVGRKRRVWSGFVPHRLAYEKPKACLSSVVAPSVSVSRTSDNISHVDDA
jgi:hypothetical protein